ncbi:hypothetical protein BDY24DRAFT_395818 [Mrakia frigida]|uniref:uncharacterized protein n=1 Tax=Mrakia frigida TaxID=29902 RepID=UPI003FCBF02D
MGLLQTCLTWLPLAVLLHAAFSAYEHLAHLKALDRQDSLPSSIVIEALAAFAVFLVGVPLSSQPLMKISWESYMQSRTIDEVDSKLAFARMRTRAETLFGRDKPL